MCKEMPVILVNWVVDKKRIIGKWRAQRRRGTRESACNFCAKNLLLVAKFSWEKIGRGSFLRHHFGRCFYFSITKHPNNFL
jgi:hypothetical protein